MSPPYPPMTEKNAAHRRSSRVHSVAQSDAAQKSQENSLDNDHRTGGNITPNTAVRVTPSPNLHSVSRQPLPQTQPQNEPSGQPSIPHSARPGRITSERLAFLNQHDTSETRTHFQPSQLNDQAIQPYSGPNYIETDIPKHTSEDWAYGTGRGRKPSKTDRSDRFTSDTPAPTARSHKLDLNPSISAFEYAIAPYLEASPLDTPPADIPSPSDDSSNSSSIYSQSPTFFTDLQENLYPGPDPDPVAFIDSYLQDLNIQQRALLAVWRTIMTRCILLATPIAESQSHDSTVTIENYDRTCHEIRRYALPIAERLQHVAPLEGLCWYWLGRAEAGLEDFDAAIQAFQKAIAYGFCKLGQMSEDLQAERANFWLEKVMEAKRAKEQTNRPKPRRMDSDLDAINFATQNDDRADADFSSEQLGLRWHPNNEIGARKFTESEWNYITHTPKNVRRTMLKKEVNLTESVWKICERQQNDWLSLYEGLGYMKSTQDPNDRT